MNSIVDTYDPHLSLTVGEKDSVVVRVNDSLHSLHNLDSILNVDSLDLQ